MDTLSRDSNNSGSILPLVGAIAGGLALILSVVALYKLSPITKSVTELSQQVDQKNSALEGEIHAADAKSQGDLKNMRDNFQNVLTSVGETIGGINGRLTKIEEAAKARAVAAPSGMPPRPPAATAAPRRPLDANSADDIERRLETLKHLREKGLISEDDYRQKRKEILDLL